MIETLEALLKTHDWYYEYADDYRVWKRGLDERKNISRLMSELLESGQGEECVALYNNISPNCDTHRFTHGDKITVVSIVEGAYHYEFLTEDEYESK